MNPEATTFEQNMLRLEQIVRAMEKGDVPLDDSLKLFQEATELVRCPAAGDKSDLRRRRNAL